MGCWNERGSHSYDLAAYMPWTPHPTTNLDSWECLLVDKAAERLVGEFGSTTHMADGEDHTHNKEVTNTSRFGEEAGEEQGGEKKEIEVLVSFKEKGTLKKSVLKKNKSS